MQTIHRWKLRVLTGRTYVSDPKMRLLVVKAAMTVNGGAARDLLRNLEEISALFEVKFACLNILPEQRQYIEKLGIEIIVPSKQWIPEGGLWNEIFAGQERSASTSWRNLIPVHEAIKWADAIHLTGGNGSMEFPQFVDSNTPMHLHYLESKPGIHDNISHYSPNGKGKWKAFIMHLLQTYQRKRIEESFLLFKNNNSWIVSANSKFSAENLYKIYGIKGNVLYPSVDLSEFTRKETVGEVIELEKIGDLKGRDYVVTVGRISRFKGIYEAIEHLVGNNLDLVLIGGGNSKENRKLKIYAEQNNVKITILSGISSEAMRGVIRYAKAVIGFAHGEAFGLTPIEAMAIGTPPIFVNEGGYRETIVNKKNGMLLERGDSISWISAFELINDPSVKEKWANAGLLQIEKMGLTPENHAQRLLKILNQLILEGKIKLDAEEEC